jgi:spore coat polysaccharide biosynthesis protein SpsF (cytidylyltransferase family)
MKVLIGIQARSGSTRLPRKAFELISGRMMLDRVVEACKNAAGFIEKSGHRCSVAVLTPTGDPIVREFSPRVDVVEGPEMDVLGRYAVAVEKYDPEMTIRVTGDCPLIPPALISYMLGLAFKNNYDYLSNCDERFRTSIDGADVEVISRRLFEYCADAAVEAYDREHVTPLIRRAPPVWARLGLAVNHYDLSAIKLSVDTPDDLENVRKHFETAYSKLQGAMKIYGKGAIHRL